MNHQTTSPDDELRQLIHDGQHTMSTVQAAHERLVSDLNRPARLDPVVLSTDRLWRDYDRAVADPVLSVGLYNPLGLRVYLGLTGSPTAAAHAVPVPPMGAIVLPTEAALITVGVDPADTQAMSLLAGAGDEGGVVFLLRWDSVQPFFYGALAL